MNLNDVVDDAVDSHPIPSAQAPQIVSGVVSSVTDQATAVAAESQTPVVRDNKGTPYDPALHAHPPRITARGTWAKRRGDSDGLSPAEALRNIESPLIDSAPPGPPPINTREIAETWAQRFFLFSVAAFGDDWQPTSAERADVTGSLERYMIASGWQIDLPPGWALIAAIATYSLPHLFSGGIKGGFVGKMIEKRRLAKEAAEDVTDQELATGAESHRQAA